MANAVGNIYIGLHVDTQRTRALGSVADSVIRDSSRMRTALSGTSRSVTQLRTQMNQGFRLRLFNDVLRQASQANNEVAKLRATMLALSAITGSSISTAFAGAFLLQTADAANRLNNQLRTVTDSEENLIAIRRRLHDVSQVTRSDMQASVTLFARNSRAAREFGKSQEEMIRVTETIQKAFAIGGASQAEASGAAIQLSQGIASDRFSGEEYRSVSENAPVLLQEMAKHLDVSIGKLREMAHAGELTGKAVIEAIQGAGKAIDRDFNKTIPTVGQALTRLNNAFLQNIGNVDASYGVTRRLSEAMSNLSENFDEVAKYAGIATAAIGGIFLARGASRGSQNAMGGIAGWLGGVGGKGIAAQVREEVREIARQRTVLKRELAGIQTTLSGGATVGPSRFGPGAGISGTAKDMGLIAAYNDKLAQVEGLNQRAATATMKATKAMSAFSVATRVGASAMSLVGGPVGIAFLALFAGIGAMSAHMAQVQERTAGLKRELHDLGLITDEVAGIADKTVQSLDDLAADELRTKLRSIADEISRMRGEQNIFEKLFAFDPQQLGNMMSQIDTQLRGTMTRGGGFRSGLSVDDQDAAKKLKDLVAAAQQGTISAEMLLQKLDLIANDNPDMAPWLDDMIGNLRTAVPYMEGLAAHSNDLADALKAVGNEVDRGWLEQMIAEQDAIAKAVAAGKVVRGTADDMVREAGFTEEEARLEKVVAALRKEAEARGDITGIQRASLELDAKRIIAAEDAAKKLEDQQKAQEDLAEKVTEFKGELGADGLTLINRETGAVVADLLDQFETGNMEADTLRRRLEEIGTIGLSDEMQKLIEKIVAAIPQLAALLGIFNSFDGEMSGPVYGRGAVGRSRRKTAAMKGVGTGVADEAIRVAGLSERDAFVEGKMKDLSDAAKDLGGVLPADEARATAEELWKLDQAQDAAKDSATDAADAAKKYADGMQDLSDELALIPLGDFAEEVFEAGKSMGLSRAELDQFIESVSSGGLDAAPGKFRDIAKAMQEVAVATEMADLGFEAAQMFRDDTEQRVFETLRDMGLEVESTYGRVIASQIRMVEQMKLAGEVTKEFFGGLVTDLMNGASFTDALSNAFGRLGQRLIDMALDQAINGLLSTLLGSVGGIGGIGGLKIPGGLNGGTGGFSGSVKMSAKGNVFGGPGISAYSNSIVKSPTLFPFARGVGLMGEAGAEAIMPLTRNRQGQLGVHMINDGKMTGGGAPVFNFYGAPSEPERQPNGTGGFDFIFKEMDRRLSNGTMGKGYAARHGLSPRTRRT